jgi:hypothetical protein
MSQSQITFRLIPLSEKEIEHRKNKYHALKTVLENLIQRHRIENRDYRSIEK